MNCDSSFIVYALECKCGLQYVGRTSRTLREHMNKHRFNITNGYTKHSHNTLFYHNCDYKKFTITPIEQINVKKRIGLKT